MLYLTFVVMPLMKNCRAAKFVNKILNVNLSPSGKLYWPDLDIDLSVEILDAPERFPLISK